MMPDDLEIVGINDDMLKDTHSTHVNLKSASKDDTKEAESVKPSSSSSTSIPMSEKRPVELTVDIPLPSSSAAATTTTILKQDSPQQTVNPSILTNLKSKRLSVNTSERILNTENMDSELVNINEVNDVAGTSTTTTGYHTNHNNTITTTTTGYQEVLKSPINTLRKIISNVSGKEEDHEVVRSPSFSINILGKQSSFGSKHSSGNNNKNNNFDNNNINNNKLEDEQKEQKTTNPFHLKVPPETSLPEYKSKPTLQNRAQSFNLSSRAGLVNRTASDRRLLSPKNARISKKEIKDDNHLDMYRALSFSPHNIIDEPNMNTNSNINIVSSPSSSNYRGSLDSSLLSPRKTVHMKNDIHLIRANSYIDAVHKMSNEKSELVSSRQSSNETMNYSQQDSNNNNNMEEGKANGCDEEAQESCSNIPWTNFAYYDGTRESLVDLAADIYELFDCNFDRYVY